MKVVLGGLLLLTCLGCGGDDPKGARFAIYHLETAIGRPGDEGELRCGPPRTVCPGVVPQPPPRTFRYRVLAAPALTDEHIIRSTVRRTGTSGLTVEFTAEGSDAFARLTREAARIGGRDQTWHHIAVVVGDEVVAFPQIDFDDYPDGIRAAPAIHLQAVSAADARDLVQRLRGE
jgi:hypothetical protein